MVNCNPQPHATNHCGSMLFDNINKTQGIAAALKTDYKGACCLQVHVGFVPAHMTAT